MYTDTVYLLPSPLAALYGTHPTKQFVAQLLWGNNFGQIKEVVSRGGGYLVSNKGVGVSVSLIVVLALSFLVLLRITNVVYGL